MDNERENSVISDGKDNERCLEYNKFANCCSEYRGAPFWALNDMLERGLLVHQINSMNRQGIGGFFMHPRGGLVDKYLGTEYMEAIRTCIEEAERLGMKAWIYDEDWCPSGYAAGMLVKDYPEFRQKALVMEKVYGGCFNHDDDDDNIIKIFSKTLDSDGIESYADITHLKPVEIRFVKQELLVFKVAVTPVRRGFNGQGYTDLCNKEAVDRFIEITHEKYKELFESYFGETVPGVFTDEPNFETKDIPGSLPWTLRFEDEFFRLKGYNISDVLPSLFLASGRYKKVRFDYWDVISGMFVNAFTKNIYDWCESNGLNLTGHYWEHEFPDPTFNGSNMSNYEFMHYPGIDMLFNTDEEVGQFGNELIVKEAASIAGQLGKERVMSESYGASGWDLDFDSQKRIADWQFALGINFICQHLVLYSLRGYRKRDFPLSFLDHQPWWGNYRAMGDYIGRLSYALSRGKYAADVLVLHPVSSTWAEFDINMRSRNVRRIEKDIKALLKTLCRLQVFYDLGDETIAERYGRVEQGRLVIGGTAYSTVIIPTMTMIRNSTYKLLAQFADAGGKIISAGITPDMVDAEYHRGLVEFFRERVVRTAPDYAELGSLLDSCGASRLHISETNGRGTKNIYSNKRIVGKKEIIFICNTDKNEQYCIRLPLPDCVYVEEWNPQDGQAAKKPVYKDEKGYYIEFELHPSGSVLFVMDYEKIDRAQEYPDNPGRKAFKINLEDWKGERTGCNALTLNRCSVTVDGECWEEGNVLELDGKIKDFLGVERGSIFNNQPWMFDEKQLSVFVPVIAKYEFTIDEGLEGDLFAAIELPGENSVMVNGSKVEPCGKFYVDKAFIMYDIREAAKPGLNEILLEAAEYNVLSALESIYVVGDFAVKRIGGSFSLVRENGCILPGDWTAQGYPYYSGSVKYTSDFILEELLDGEAVLELGNFMGVLAKVSVNGTDVVTIAWKPYLLNVERLLKAGANQITVEVFNSLQNLLGPHHDSGTKGIVVPQSFYSMQDIHFASSGFDGTCKLYIY